MFHSPPYTISMRYTWIYKWRHLLTGVRPNNIYSLERRMKKKERKCLPSTCINSCCTNKHFADIIMFYICKLCVSKSWNIIFLCPVVLHVRISFSNMYICSLVRYVFVILLSWYSMRISDTLYG